MKTYNDADQKQRHLKIQILWQSVAKTIMTQQQSNHNCRAGS